MTIKPNLHVGIAISLALAGCGVKVNGTSYGLGGKSNSSAGSGHSNSAGTGSGTGSGDGRNTGNSHQPPALIEGALSGHADDICPMPSGIADPWSHVDGTTPKPIRFMREEPGVERSCTAAEDHCVRSCLWMAWSRSSEKGVGGGVLTAYTPDDGPADNRDPDLVYYRTVPATRRLLAAGALVAITKEQRPLPNPDLSGWLIGTLDHVDWKSHKVYIKGHTEPGLLSSTRVAVLSFRQGGAIEILGGRSRDGLRPSKDEVFLPVARAAVTIDPWSQVGPDGQPLASDDTRPYETSYVDCTAAVDHCLRPWVWLVEYGVEVHPAKFIDGDFSMISSLDHPVSLSRHRGAYRTVPATRSNVKVGSVVYAPRGGDGFGTEAEAHGEWERVTIKELRADGTYLSDARDAPRALTYARIPVVYWSPGDKAEKVE